MYDPSTGEKGIIHTVRVVERLATIGLLLASVDALSGGTTIPLWAIVGLGIGVLALRAIDCSVIAVWKDATGDEILGVSLFATFTTLLLYTVIFGSAYILMLPNTYVSATLTTTLFVYIIQDVEVEFDL